MDHETLVAAKSYTDEKCAGGGTGGGLPVVELETVAISQSAELTAEESAKVEAMNGKPFCAVFTADVAGMVAKFSMVMHGFVYEGMTMYGATMGTVRAELHNVDGVWVIAARQEE